MKLHTIATVSALIGDYLKDRGYKRAAYWLGEDTAGMLGLDAGHHDRRTAARALMKCGEVTLDVNYSGQLTHHYPSYTVALNVGGVAGLSQASERRQR